ncbi:hypothetical protein BH11PSE9_BH11PSE9_00430 [soil metagenome]
MPLLGKAAVAMWWDMAAAHRVEFEDWHSHEHFPERLGIPGFQRGSRWASATGGEGFFIMYELQAYETLTSPAYFARLNDPTPWSVKMMPHHSNMVRSQCQVLESHGGGIAGAMLTIRLSPAPGQAQALRDHLCPLLADLPQRAGVTATHLLQTQTPQAASTAEQKIRGGADGVADWIVLVSGYEAQTLMDLAANELGAPACSAASALPTQVSALYRLSYTMTPNDL